MNEHVRRWALISVGLLLPAAAFAAAATPAGAGLCGSVCAALFGCGG